MESPPTHTRTGSLLLATQTLGGGTVGFGLGLEASAALPPGDAPAAPSRRHGR